MRYIFILFLCFIQLGCVAQPQEYANEDCIRIAFYNVENYFDPFKDSIKNDDSFTLDGENHWSYKKFEKKRNNLYKTIVALGGWSSPAIVGLCEVENGFVLKELCSNTPLRKLNYKYVHFESPDVRGIDVAMLYRPDLFQCLSAHPISINFPFDSVYKTRDILYVKGVVFETDTLNIFVNHFPSRLGGEAANRRRNYVAKILKQSVDSILFHNSAANVIIMGDFNDEATDYSMKEVLKVKLFGEEDAKKVLQNTFDKDNEKEGSYKYQAAWSVIDQLIVSDVLYKGNGSLCIKNGKSFIFKADFLFTNDEKNIGRKPFRTYLGTRYNGGFSDHLPIYMDLIKCKN